MALRSRLRDFTLGADPEFVILDARSEDTRALFGADYVKSSHGSLGVDGCSQILEVRPDPSHNPLEVVTNIRQVFIENIMNLSSLANCNWIAGSCHRDPVDMYGDRVEWPLGGHIHLGISRSYIGPRTATNLLSQYVGLCTVLMEDKKGGLLRRKPYDGYSYGRATDYRITTYGFEYRTPSSWITSPYVAAAVLCLAKTVVFEAINNVSFEVPVYVKNKNITKMETAVLRKAFPQVWRSITKMALYQTYKPFLDILYFIITNNLTWFPQCSMKMAWGVGNLNRALPFELTTMEAIWARHILYSNRNV